MKSQEFLVVLPTLPAISGAGVQITRYRRLSSRQPPTCIDWARVNIRSNNDRVRSSTAAAASMVTARPRVPVWLRAPGCMWVELVGTATSLRLSPPTTMYASPTFTEITAFANMIHNSIA